MDERPYSVPPDVDDEWEDEDVQREQDNDYIAEQMAEQYDEGTDR